MPTYYYEYVVPSDEFDSLNPEQRRKRRTDPSMYTVAQSGTAYAQDETIAASIVNDLVSDGHPEYEEYGYGVVMFTEVPENTAERDMSVFTDSDWRERLERAVSDPENTIIISEDELDDF